VNNVIAELRGREKPDEWVLVGAHLDSWDLATGAQDNGTGTAMVLEAARAIVQSGKTPRRSLRFVLWGGEEQGLLGSRAYVKAHMGELDKIVAVLNTDHGSGAPKGWVVGGREDVTAALKPIGQRLLKGLGGGELSQTVSCDTDHASFFVRGVPAFTLWTDGEHYPEIHHLGSDTFDKVSPGNLAAGSAVVAVTAWAVAEREARLGAPLDEAAVDSLLEKGDQKQCKQRLAEPLLQ
jgi:carboxypeptidase Q